jgi:hypothetical protein
MSHDDRDADWLGVEKTRFAAVLVLSSLLCDPDEAGAPGCGAGGQPLSQEDSEQTWTWICNHRAKWFGSGCMAPPYFCGTAEAHGPYYIDYYMYDLAQAKVSPLR